MHTADNFPAEDHPGSEKRSSRWIALLAAPSLLVIGTMILAARPLAARQDEERAAAPKFHKIGNHYVSLSNVSHVIDEPGEKMPPGSLQAFFDGGPDWLPITGEEAEVFRKMIGKVTLDLTPKAAKAKEPGDSKKSSGGLKKPAPKKKPSFIEIH